MTDGTSVQEYAVKRFWEEAPLHNIEPSLVEKLPEILMSCADEVEVEEVLLKIDWESLR